MNFQQGTPTSSDSNADEWVAVEPDKGSSTSELLSLTMKLAAAGKYFGHASCSRVFMNPREGSRGFEK